jgi:hypothetical protein
MSSFTETCTFVISKTQSYVAQDESLFFLITAHGLFSLTGAPVIDKFADRPWKMGYFKMSSSRKEVWRDAIS